MYFYHWTATKKSATKQNCVNCYKINSKCVILSFNLKKI